MATPAKKLIGHMDCMCCGSSIPVKEAENGTLNASCAWCDFPGWAKAGTLAARIIRSKLKPGAAGAAAAQPAPAPAPKPPATAAATPVPTPAPRKAPISVFHLA